MKVCISCGQPMSPAGDRAPSLGNPNQCVPCCTGHQLPAEGSAAYRATDGPTTLPPATAPAACIIGDAGPETTAAGGNPLTSDLYVDTPQNAARYTVHTEAAASEVNPFPAGRWTVPKRSNGSVPAPTRSSENCMAGPLGNPDADHEEKRLSHADLPWDEESEALTLELRRKGIQSIPADTHQDDYAWRMLL